MIDHNDYFTYFIIKENSRILFKYYFGNISSKDLTFKVWLHITIFITSLSVKILIMSNNLFQTYKV